MKLNKKGFTLVELLAVIIILAIVVGITIPTVLDSIDTARKSGLQTSADTTADWFQRQLQAFQIGDTDISPVNSLYVSACTTGTDVNGTCTYSVDLVKAAGLKSTNVSNMTVTYTESTGTYCVKIYPSKTGEYKKLTNESETKFVQSSNCPTSTEENLIK